MQAGRRRQGRISEAAGSWLAALVLDGRLGDPPLPRPLQSSMRHPKVLAHVTEPQVLVNAGNLLNRRCASI